MSTVLVTDGAQRSALATVRSLGQAGHRVVVASDSGRSLAGASKYVAVDFRLPDTSGGESAYVSGVVEAVGRHSVELVIPITDAASLALLSARDALAPAVVVGPTAGAFACVSDKRGIVESGGKGLQVPRSWSVSSRSAVPDLAPADFPLVVKPARSVVGTADGGIHHTRVTYARDLAALNERLADLRDAAFPILLQERIEGPGVGAFLLRREGRTLAAFAHRRLREKPPSGGVSVLRESIALDPALRRAAEALLDACGFDGAAMIETKVCQRTGQPFLMEVNGRLWGSLQLAIDAGVDFPRLLVDAWLGRDVEPPRYRLGVRTRWWWGDVDHHLALVRGVDGGPPLPKWKAAVGLARPSGSRLEVFRLSDIRPFLRESRDWWREALASR